MKKLIWCLILLSAWISGDALAATKVDPMFGFLRRTTAEPALMGLAVKAAGVTLTDDTVLVGSIIRTTDTKKVAGVITELGGRVKTVLKTIVTAEIPLDAVGKISALEEVVYIEAAKRLTPKMDYARSSGITNVVDVQSSYNGDGVMVGIYDSGVDCSHADFKNASGSPRVVGYWEMGINTKYTAEEIAAGRCSDSSYHGTHVAGIAAGRDATYTGVAPGASLVVSEMSVGSEDEVIDAITYIFQTAQASLAPTVVNLSLGTSIGPHDNTSAFEVGINETLTGKEGRAIVCAAGNENVNTFDDADAGGILGGLHAAVSVSGTDSGYEAIIRNSSIRSLVMDIWLAEGGGCNIELAAYNTSRTQVLTTGEVAAGGEEEATTANLGLALDFTDSANADNGKQHAQATVVLAATGAYQSTDLTYDIIFRDNGGGCSGDVWLYQDMVAYNVFTDNRGGEAGPTGDYTYVNGDSNKMITVPATASGCVAVASFSARDTWADIDGTTQEENVYESTGEGTGTEATGISLFSSKGPGAGSANIQKPEITAPGEPIISTLASTVTVTNRALLGNSTHLKLQGTSMSAPLVTGIVALMLQKNGCLTPSQIKSLLTDNAMTDAETGTNLPDYVWGYGKVDASAAVEAVTASDCQPDNPGDNPVSPTSSNKGCSLVRFSEPSAAGAGALAIVIIAAVILCVRRRIALQI